MEKVYKCKNGTIHVTVPKTCDREELRKVTEDFLKKVINGGKNNGNCYPSRNFREEQVSHR